MKKYLETNELAALFFLHYFKYTRYAFKKQKSEEDIASINAHRELMRLFGRLHNVKARVGGKSVVDMIAEHISPSNTPFAREIRMIKRLFKKLFGSRSKRTKEYHITNLSFGCIE